MADKKKIIIHIGIDKTGSTSIQSFFRENEKYIKLHRIHYFSKKFGELYHWKIKYLFSQKKSINWDNELLKNKETKEDIKINLSKEIEENIEHNDIFILSHEDICMLDLEDFENLKTFFSKYFDLIIPIIYIREYVSYAISKKTHKLKTLFGSDKHFYKNIPLHDYSLILNNLQICFKNFKIGIFDKEELLNQNIIEDFLFKCDLIDILNDNRIKKKLYINKNLNEKSIIHLFFFNKLRKYCNSDFLKKYINYLDKDKGQGIQLNQEQVKLIKDRAFEYENLLYEKFSIKFKNYEKYKTYTFSNINLFKGFFSFITSIILVKLKKD